MKNVTKIDYCRLKLSTYTVDIPCWIGGEAEMVCYVQSNETIVIRPDSKMFIPVNIPKCEHLSKLGVLEPSMELFMRLTRTILRVYPNMEPSLQNQLQEYLEDLFSRSAVNLEETERQDLAKLLTKYQNVFSKSKGDLGHTDLVQHKINTGSAVRVITKLPSNLTKGKSKLIII